MFELLAVAFSRHHERLRVHPRQGGDQARLSGAGRDGAHDAVSDEQRALFKFEQEVKLNRYHISVTAHFRDKQKWTPDGDGGLLEQSLVLHGGGISGANKDSHIDLALVMMAGRRGERGTGSCAARRTRL